MGSFLRIDFRKGELPDLTERFPELTVFGADLAGESVYRIEPPAAGILVIGAEGPGVSKAARTQVQKWLTIPRAPGREAESLNAAVAAGILCGRLSTRS
ncbi:MAG: TrmH family RNA methyltransferase [Limisphaerales bacterium]|jgi:TrmH family RNA methyltransferase